MTHTTSFRLTAVQRAKLQQLADALGTNRNATMQQLIDNAQIVPIVRHEATAVLTAKKNSPETQLSTAGVKAVRA